MTTNRRECYPADVCGLTALHVPSVQPSAVYSLPLLLTDCSFDLFPSLAASKPAAVKSNQPSITSES